MGEEFSCKDFRTWGGTLTAAIALAERGPVEGTAEQKRVVAAVMRKVGERLGNTPTVARNSYVSPAVVEQYLDGRTIEDFRPRNLRIVTARDIGLDQEEQATLVVAAFVADTRGARSRVEFQAQFTGTRGGISWPGRPCSSATTAVRRSRRERVRRLRLTYTDARRGAKQADLCDDCAGKMPGTPTARRGRRPKAAATAA